MNIQQFQRIHFGTTFRANLSYHPDLVKLIRIIYVKLGLNVEEKDDSNETIVVFILHICLLFDICLDAVSFGFVLGHVVSSVIHSLCY